MDLRSVLNTSDNGDRAPAKAPPTPQQQQPPRPGQSPAQYGYRDFAHQPPQPSPSKPISQDYPHPSQHQHPNAYPPPSPYQAPNQYQSRAAPPPPLQPPSGYHDPRSPVSSRSSSVPTASPYRPTPTSTTTPGSSSAGYPFPPTQAAPEMQSPVQRQQYPPAQYQHQRRESYVQGPGVAPSGHAAPPHQYVQQHSVPQPSPVGTPSASSHPYPQQRAHSIHSTPTANPTPAQHQYGPSYAQGSPVLASQPPPSDYNRHPSQPPTPLGPPQPAAQRQPSAAGGFAQPPSPYQQRMSSGAIAPPQQQQLQQQPQPQPQPSPKTAPPPPPPAHRLSNSHSTYESPSSDTAPRPISQHDRDSSLSVSPKTRLGSIPSNADTVPTPTERDSRQSLGIQSMVIDSDRAVTPAKRKLEDRNMSPGELEHREPKPPPGDANGGHIDRLQKSASPAVPRKKRVPRAQPPVWALSVHTLGKKLPKNANFVLQKRTHSHIHAPLNGKHEPVPKADDGSRQVSPEATRATNATSSQQPPSAPEAGPRDQLGPWEASITGVKPLEELSKNVADFLFIHVINNQDMQEIISRGIQFEIEAKLGTLIDKDTNHRVDRFVSTECVLDDNSRVAFKSSMTEAQHKAYNDFLNGVVIQTDPRNPNGASRVQVHYKHRREIDRFFELPQELQGHLPGCVRARLGPRSRNVRVRVTYDQKTKEVLGKIIKARVADIDLHLPMCPMDCRISINLEMNWDGSVEELEQSAPNKGDRQPDRNKDRLSYTQGSYQIDLTQVTYANGPGNAQRQEKEHELEIELSPQVLIDQGRRAMNGAPHRYQELVEGLVDNVRVLARKAKEFTK